MKILDLRDNALFLQNWRERMRLPSRLSGIILTVIITGLIFLSAYLNPPRIYPYHGGGPREIFWLNSVFWSLAVFQGVISSSFLGPWPPTRWRCANAQAARWIFTAARPPRGSTST